MVVVERWLLRGMDQPSSSFAITWRCQEAIFCQLEQALVVVPVAERLK